MTVSLLAWTGLKNDLASNVILMGDTITDPDIRIFPTLARFDLVSYQK